MIVWGIVYFDFLWVFMFFLGFVDVFDFEMCDCVWVMEWVWFKIC